MPYIYQVQRSLSFASFQRSNQCWMNWKYMYALCGMAFQGNYSIALKRHDLLSDRIYKVYSRYIPYIYCAYTMRR